VSVRRPRSTPVPSTTPSSGQAVVAADKRGKLWPPAADAKARQILREHAEELYDEAERVADRSGSDSVAVGYIEQAAHTVRIRRTTGGPADVLLSVGTAVIGLGGGALLASAGAAEIAGWVPPTSVGMLVVGAVMSAIGGTVKWIRR
jgi:hypothetical protein